MNILDHLCSMHIVGRMPIEHLLGHPHGASLDALNSRLWWKWCLIRCWQSRTSSPPNVATCSNTALSPAACSPTHGSPASSRSMAAPCSTTRARRTPRCTPGAMWMLRCACMPSRHACAGQWRAPMLHRMLCHLLHFASCLCDGFSWGFLQVLRGFLNSFHGGHRQLCHVLVPATLTQMRVQQLHGSSIV